MADDMIELGLEAFDFVTDRYHDNIYDGVNRAGPWIKEQRVRTRFGQDGRKEKEKITTLKPDQNMPGGQNQPVIEEKKKYKENSQGRTQSVGSPEIRVKGQLDDRGSRSHIYPPAPAPMGTPYPNPGQAAAGGALVAMPPDGQYPGQSRGFVGRPVYRSEYEDSEDSEYDDRDRGHRRRHHRRHGDDDRGLRRSRSAYESRRRSKSRSRGDPRGRDDWSDDGKYPPEPRGLDKAHLAATVTGAVAGGYLGRSAGKGDVLATVAGALAGAFTANVAERNWEKHNRRKEDKWEEKWGYRS